MKKFLVVGCGGSGAKTQAYMIDQLKAHIRSFDPTLTSLPKAWQFVSVDVPIEPEPGPDGLGNVQVNGGRYVGIGSKEQYRTFDSGITRMLGEKKALGEVATWSDRHPESRTTPISDGAGQFRGLGRMLTLRAIPRIREELRAALNTLEEADTLRELDELNHKITGHHQNSAEASTVILVISSMAGGAGASMFLDVCRILATLPNGKPEHTGVFMYTPEVFENLPAESMVGAWPNALAMFGEAVATQTGASTESDVALFKALGVNAGGSRNTFARLFPIGARMGAKGARFGDGSPNTVYRGLGRSLAALMTSEKSAEAFVAYSLGNTGAPEADRSLFGWASPTDTPWDFMPWGSMGYAQLSMGRDRYAEYSAQRLARTAFDRILTGHMDPRSTDTGEEQLKKRVADRYPDILDQIGLGQWITERQGPAFIAQWVSYLCGNQAATAAERSRQWLRQQLPTADGMKATEWADLVRGKLGDPGNSWYVTSQLDADAYTFVHSFADQFCDMVTAMAEENIASVGLPFVEKVLEQLAKSIREQLVRPLAEYAAQSVIRGDWNTDGAEKAPKDTLARPAATVVGGNRCGWVSPHLTASPTGGEERESHPGTFTAKLRPADLLQRSRMWIQRPDYHFHRFISTDLRSYMTQDELTTDVTFDNRMNRLRSAFTTALAQARPLAAVDSAMISRVHHTSESYHYNFSEIPFKANSAAEALRAVLNGTTHLDDATADSLDSSLTQGTKVRHIDVFGSYPNYSPVVFSSLFPHIVKDWNSRTNHDGFWTLRRSRPLAGALPLSKAERQAMVGGWLIGSVTGRIYIQDQGRPTACAYVFDDDAQQWVPFPDPLLTTPAQFKAQLDWMPAVIESVLLAYADIQSQDDRGRLAQSLRPYHLLRALYDSNASGPTTGVTRHPSVDRIADFLRTGTRPGQAVAGTSVADRYDFFLGQLDQAARNADNFLPGNGPGLPGSQAQGKPWAEVTDRGYASAMPFYRDLAPDVRDITRALKTNLGLARAEAERPVQSGPVFPGDPFGGPGAQPAPPTGPALPDFGDGMI